jgi:hypothetical protein
LINDELKIQETGNITSKAEIRKSGNQEVGYQHREVSCGVNRVSGLNIEYRNSKSCLSAFAAMR